MTQFVRRFLQKRCQKKGFRWLWHLTMGAGLLASSAHAAANPQCTALLPVASTEVVDGTPITAERLAQIRDIVTSSEASLRPLTYVHRAFNLAPDRDRVALLLRSGDTERNGYCFGVVSFSLANPSDTRLIHSWFEDMRAVPEPITRETLWIGAWLRLPRWAPDGATVAFLKRADGVVNLWLANSDGSGARNLSHSAVDVFDFAWSDDGRSIVWTSQPQILDRLSQIEEEGLNGFHFDDRFRPARGPRPYLVGTRTARPPHPDDIPSEHFAVEVRDGNVRPATSAEIALFESVRGRTAVGAPYRDLNDRGDVAEIVDADPGNVLSSNALLVRTQRGEEIRCTASECANPIMVWWAAHGNSLYFMRREGWGRGYLATYVWAPGSSAPARTFRTTDLIRHCEPIVAGLLCDHEDPRSPRRLVILDPATGASRPVFDPNPEVANWTFGAIERLEWQSEGTPETWGYLVLPPGYERDHPLPLIVVGYQARGFLRGGIGDEYPIQAFAARGYAVLVYEHIISNADYSSARTGEQVRREMIRNWTNRRMAQSSLEAGIRNVQARVPIDDSRVGITGVSEGASIAAWALINSDLFSVASINGCCQGPSTTLGGLSGWEVYDRFQASGHPRSNEPANEFWQPAAIELNVPRIHTPILIQAADSEYLGAIPALTRFRDLNRPVELFIFPKEGHTKYQPAHRLAVYQRNLDWFDFWLRGIENDTPGRAPEYARWRAWRDQRNAAASRPAAETNPIPSAPGNDAAPAVAR